MLSQGSVSAGSVSSRPFDGSHYRTCLVGALHELILRDRVGYDACACLDVALLSIHEEGADRDAGGQVAAEVCVKDAAAVDTAPGGFELLDDLHGADLGCSAKGSSREAGLERVDGGEVRAELAFERAHQVHHVAVDRK